MACVLIGAATIIETVNQSDGLQHVLTTPYDQGNEIKVNSKGTNIGAHVQNSNSANNNSVASVATGGSAGTGDTADANLTTLGKCASTHGSGGVQQQHGYQQLQRTQ